MTTFRLIQGTLVTYDGIAARVGRRCVNPEGYFLHPLNDPQHRFAVSDREVEDGIRKRGRFRNGVDQQLLPEGHAALEAAEDSLLSEQDCKWRDYKLRLAAEIDRELSKPAAVRVDRKEAARLAVESTAPPEGIAAVSPRTALKAYDVYRLAGTRSALAPKSAIKGNRVPRKPDFVLEAIEDAIDEKYCGKGSLPRVREHAIRLAMRAMPPDLSLYRTDSSRSGGAQSLIPFTQDGAVDWESLISEAAVRRAKNNRAAVFRAIREIGPEEAKQAFDTSLAAPMVTRPLSVAEADSFTLNGVFVVDDRSWFPLGYPWVTIIMDSASRSGLGLGIGFAPDSDTVLRAVRHAVMPKDLSTIRFDDGRPVFAKEWTQAGQIQLVKVDLGKQFLSRHTKDALLRCGTHFLPLKPRRPKLKGKVERFIKTLKYGPVGEELGILPRRLRKQVGTGEVLLVTLTQLELILTYWIVEIYHQDNHEALGIPPQQMWDTQTVRMPVTPPPSEADVDLIVGHYEVGTLNRNGIRHEGLEYNSPALGALRSREADNDGTMDVEFKVDPANIDTIWVLARDPHRDGRLMLVPGYCRQMHYARGLPRYRHNVIRAYAKEQANGGPVTIFQLMEAKHKLAELARTMFEEREKKFGTVNIGRYLNAGRSYLLEGTELPEDSQGTDQPLALVDRSLEATPDDMPQGDDGAAAATSSERAVPVRSKSSNPSPEALAADPPGRHVRRKLGSISRG